MIILPSMSIFNFCHRFVPCLADPGDFLIENQKWNNGFLLFLWLMVSFCLCSKEIFVGVESNISGVAYCICGHSLSFWPWFNRENKTSAMVCCFFLSCSPPPLFGRWKWGNLRVMIEFKSDHFGCVDCSCNCQCICCLLGKGSADGDDPKPRLLALGGGVTSRRSAAISRNHNHMHSQRISSLPIANIALEI